MLNGFGNPFVQTDLLQIGHIPPKAEPRRQVMEFAATLDLKSEASDGTRVRGVADVDAESSLLDKRIALYAEWRRHNHFGCGPDSAKLEQLQKVLDQMRSTLER